MFLNFALTGSCLGLSCAGLALDLQPTFPLGYPHAGTPFAQILSVTPALAVRFDKARDSISFAHGSSDIDASNVVRLRAHSQRLRRNPETKVTLVAYAHDGGSASFELAVAEKRLRTVLEALRGMDVPRNRIAALSIRWNEDEDLCTAGPGGATRIDLVHSN